MAKKSESEHHSEDITFCASECKRTKCFRHPSHIRQYWRDHSFAYLKGTVYCELEYTKKEKSNGKT